MEALIDGLSSAFTLVNFAFIALGVLCGIIVGAIPGLIGPMAIGLLALSEILIQMEDYARGKLDSRTKGLNAFDPSIPRQDRVVTIAEFRYSFRTIIRSSIIGTVIGAIPGLGSVLAGFLGYGAAQRASRHPEEFGKGALEGVAGAEAANSAVVGANLIPTFALGIPGSVTAAILLGALVVHGLTPGPLIFHNSGEILYGIFGAMLIANFVNLFLGQVGLRFFALIIGLPKHYIHPLIVVLCIVGAYLLEQSMFSVGLMMFFAVLGYVMRKLDFSIVAFIIAFVLGPQFEESLRQTIFLFGDQPFDLLSRPITMSFFALTLFSLWRFGFGKKPAILQEPGA